MSEKADVKIATPEKSETSKPSSNDAGVEKKSVKAASETNEQRVVPLRIDRAAAAFARKAELNMRPRQVRRLLLAVSFVLLVLIPSLFGGVYFLVLASDRYSASASFAIRSMDSVPAGGDFLGAIAGLSSVGTTTTDSYIVLEYLKSRELIEKVQKEFDLRAAYSKSNIDFIYKLDQGSP